VSRRKWNDSGAPITTVEMLLTCVKDYGGAMWWGRFRNSHFFLNQQVQTLYKMVYKKCLTYPSPNKKGETK